jgi:hypothetical protein
MNGGIGIMINKKGGSIQMTDQKILEKALLKAHKNGWNPLSTISWKNLEVTQWQGNGMVGRALLYADKKDKDVSVTWVRELEGIIFNHDFAKCLWPTNLIDERITDITEIETGKRYPAWQWHLMNMVLAHNPVTYLGDNI